jgi:hypothetical protein
MLPAVSKKLKDRTREAVDHAVSEDRLFFVTLSDIVDVLIENERNEQNLKRCDNVLRSAASNAEIHMNGNSASGESKALKSEINKQIEKYSDIKYELLLKFDSLKNSLRNEMNRHSR